MINLDGVIMKNKAVIEQLKKRFDQYTIGTLHNYYFKSEEGGWGETIIKINKCQEVGGLRIEICGQSITIKQNVKDRALDDIVNAIVWDNRDGTTTVTLQISDVYVPGKCFEYYVRDKRSK